ncbi:MAG: class I SAM-dependent methyltransferase [Thermoanaerobaculum sp.]
MPRAQWGEDAEFFGPRHAFRESRILHLLAKTPPGWHLECAAGLGSLSQALAARGFRVVAVDASLKSLAVARKLAGAHSFFGVVADACRLPFRPGSFSSATSAETLEHLPEDAKALSEFARVLQAGGVLAGSVPHDPKQWSVWDEWAGHVRRYRSEELLEKLRHAGFRARVTDWGFPLVRLYDALFLRRVNRRRFEISGPAAQDSKLRWVARVGRWRWVVVAVRWLFAFDNVFEGSGGGVGLLFFAQKNAVPTVD